MTPETVKPEMIGYASHTGTKRNLDGLRREGWRLLITPFGGRDPKGFHYGIDNGAWRAFLEFQAGSAAQNLLDIPRYLALLDELGQDADFAVLPDIVGEGEASLTLTLAYEKAVLERIGPDTVPLLSVQDGMEAGNLYRRVENFARQGFGIFVGGTTEWKERTLAIWGDLKREYGCYLHCARVNTARRIRLCAAADVDSFDGTSATKFGSTLAMLAEAARQPSLIQSRGADYAARRLGGEI